MHRFTRSLRLLGAIGLLAGGLSLPPSGGAAQGDSHYFPETGKPSAASSGPTGRATAASRSRATPSRRRCRRRAT